MAIGPQPRDIPLITRPVSIFKVSSIVTGIFLLGLVVMMVTRYGFGRDIELGGGCVGCGMVDVTLKQGIEVAMKELIPEITEVIDQTDHGSGDNPYYKPSKK